jgi:general secretion pathway protein G
MSLSLKRKKTSGFSLVELLVVIAIISILVTIGLVSLNRAQQSGRDAQRRADVETIRGALAEYYADHNDYPLSTASLVGPPPAPVYLRIVPLEPDGITPYTYTQPGGTQTYCIEADLELPGTTEPICDGGNYGKTQND